MPTYPVTPPTVSGRATESLRVEVNSTDMESPFSGAFQTVQNFSRWLLDFALPPMSLVNAEEWAAFFGSLSGRKGYFNWYPWQSSTSALTGRTLSGAFTKGATVFNAAGWSGSAASTLRQGQFLHIGTQLFRITSAPANATAGVCQIEVEPHARSTIASGTAIEFVAPRGLFRLSETTTPGFSPSPDGSAEFPPVSAVEAL